MASERDRDRELKDPDDGYFPPGTVHEDVYYSFNGMDFVWDKAKSDRCYQDRGFDFRVAAHVFNDKDCIFNTDDKHSILEDRESVIGIPTEEGVSGSGPESAIEDVVIGGVDDILFVVFTERMTYDGSDYIRIISARFADKKEEEKYYKNKNSF